MDDQRNVHLIKDYVGTITQSGEDGKMQEREGSYPASAVSCSVLLAKWSRSVA